MLLISGGMYGFPRLKFGTMAAQPPLTDRRPWDSPAAGLSNL
jgi:hypothetical protein